MFAEFLSDSGWSNHSHRGWTTLLSFALQAFALGCLLLLPLFYTEGLPRLAMLTPISAPAPPAVPPAPERARSSPVPQTNLIGNTLVSPREVPQAVTMLTESTPLPPHGRLVCGEYSSRRWWSTRAGHGDQLLGRLRFRHLAAASSASPTRIAHDGRKLSPSRTARVFRPGAASTHPGPGCAASHDQPRGRD